MDRAVRMLLAAAVAAVALAGCASPVAPAPASAAPPEGVTVAVYQTRTDVGQHKLELSITNGTDGRLTITGAEFRSEQFLEPAVWPKESTFIVAGATVDLPVELGAVDCDAVDPVPVVEFDYELESGVTGTAVTEADDRIDRLPALMAEDCIQQSVEEIAVITATTAPRLVERVGALVAEVDLTVAPTGSADSLTIASWRSTTLVTPADPVSAAALPDARLDLTVAGGDAPSSVTLTLIPNRCDPHAVAEDKRGTIFPLSVVLADGTGGTLFVPAADAVRGALYDYVPRACAVTPAG